MTSSNTKLPIENAIQIIELFGGIRPMAKKMGVAVTTVQGWKKRDVIPANRRAAVIEAAREHDVDLGVLLGNAQREEDTPQTSAAPTEPDIDEAELAALVKKLEPQEDLPTPTPDVTREPTQQSTIKADPITASIKPKRSDFESQLQTTEKNAITKSVWISSALVLLGFLAVAFLFFGSNEDERLALLEEDMSDIRVDVEDVKDQQNFLTTLVPENLDERINKIQEQAIEAQQKVNEVIATTSVISDDVFGEHGGSTIERAGKLNQHVKDLTGVDLATYFGLGDLMTKFQQMQDTDIGQEKLAKTMEELSMVLMESQEAFSLQEQLEMAQEGMPTIGDTFAGVPSEDLKAAGLLLALSQFRSSLNRGNQDFSDDLQVLKTLVGDDDPVLSAAIDRLAPHSQQGILTTDGLVDEFKTIAGEAVVESIKGEDVSIQDKITGRIGEVLSVEKNGEPLVGNETQIAVKKVESSLGQGNIEQAVSLIEGLDGPAAEIFSPWLNKAKATISARDMKGMIDNVLSGDLSALGGSAGRFVRDKTGATNVYIPPSR